VRTWSTHLNVAKLEGWVVVQGVMRELVSADFPDLQGKYRENSRFGPVSALSMICKLLK
jgi:hypothetical protein